MWTRIPSSSLRVTGADRVDFVQGQMTADLRGAAVPGMVACAFLNVRGQIEQFARAYKRPDDIYLHLDEGQAATLAARLRRYIIFDQVDLSETTGTLRTVHVWDVPELAAQVPEAASAAQFEWGGGMVLAGRVDRMGTPGFDLHYLAANEANVLGTLGQESPLQALDAARIAAGIPDIARDGFTGVLLQEVGLDISGPLPAISYRKGCYVGQEIMARLEARGNARYHLARVSGTGLASSGLASHAEILKGGKVVGQTGLAVGGRALARLRKEIEAGEVLEVAGQPVTAELLTGHA